MSSAQSAYGSIHELLMKSFFTLDYHIGDFDGFALDVKGSGDVRELKELFSGLKY